MTLSHIRFILQRSVANRGVMGTLNAAPRKIFRQLSRGSEPAQQFKPAKQFDTLHPFDAEFGTDTAGLISPEDLLDRQGKRNIHNTGFCAAAPSVFQQAIARMDIAFERFTFVDLGAGKGRILLLASNLPFQQVLGVEFIPELQAAAARNISVYQPASRRCQDVQCILSDVCDFVFPTVPLVVFMWNPFAGRVFERVMANLEDTLRRHPREVYVLYLKPDFEALLKRIPSLHKVWESELIMTEQDFASYDFSDRSQVCVAYGTSAL